MAGGAVLAAVLVALAGAGCSQTARPTQVLRVWPPAPGPTRIVLREIIIGAQDFQRQDPLSVIGRLIAGEQKQVLLQPQAVAVDGDQTLYVADQGHQGIHVFNLKEGGSRFLAKAGEEFLISPAGLALCEGMLVVSDSALGLVFFLRPDGRLERTIARPGGFKRPTGLAYDPGRRLLYVVDTLAQEVCVFQPSGQFVRAFGAGGTGPGLLNFPTYAAVDDDGTVYVTDSLNFRVQAFDPQGKFLRQIGQLGDATGYMAVPKGIGVDRHGHVYVADSSLSTVQIFDREGRFLLSFGERGDGPGSFQVPAGLAIGAGDRIYVCDSFSHRLQVFQYVEPKDETTTSD
jgi:DNA-binding beta-propeller fold protein YncE